MERRYAYLPQARARIQQRAEGESPLIVGYASVFYDGTERTEYRLWTDFSERIMPGAFDRALSESHDVRALFNHDSNLVLGRTSAGTCKLSVDKVGLRYEIEAPDTQTARDLQVSLNRGDVTGSSFSFNPTNTLYREEGEMLYAEITDVDLFDVGPVTFPAYEATSSGVRAQLRAAGEAEEARRKAQEWRTAQRAAGQVHLSRDAIAARLREREARLRLG
jgi:hypothetical protein